MKASWMSYVGISLISMTFLAGCQQENVKDQSISTVEPATLTDDEFVDIKWYAQSIDGNKLTNTDTYIQFLEAGIVRGNAGCNRFVARFEEARGSVALKGLLSTHRKCFASVMYRENRLLALLKTAHQYELKPGSLKVYSSNASAPMSFTSKRIASE